MTLYGIPNCDTVKKATAWLTKNKVDFDFFDLKKGQLTKKMVNKWIKANGIEIVVNKKSTTWKNLPEKIRENFLAGSDIAEILIEYPTLIKRPVIESDNNIYIGFDEATYKTSFTNKSII